MDVFVCLNGLYPRSEALVQATRDHDRGRIASRELEQVFQEDYVQVREMQKGTPWVNDGMLAWQDLVRPLGELGGARTGALTRYFETNTFYRRLIFPEPFTVQIDPAWLNRYFRFGTHAILPSPLTLARMSTLDLEGATRLLSALLPALEARGYHTVTWMEGFIPYTGDPGLLEATLPFWKILRKAAPSLRMVLQFYFGSALPFQEVLPHLPVDGVGVDLTHTDLTAFRIPRGMGLVLGVVDTTNSLQESWDVVQEAVARALDMRPAFLGLTGSADFHFLPRDVADRKYAFLREIQEKIV